MIQLEPIGIVHNNRCEIRDDYWGGLISEIEIDKGFPEEALRGIDEYSHLEIIFYFHRADRSNATRGADRPRGNANWPVVGIFARRGKNRANHLGLTIVRLLSVDGRKLTVSGLDAIDGSPVLDIKPVLREFLPREEVRQPEWADEIMRDYWKE